MITKFLQAKLLITIVGRYSGMSVVEAAKTGGAKGSTKATGRGLPCNSPQRAATPEEPYEDIIFTLMDDCVESIIAAIKNASLADPQHINGYSVLLHVPHMLARISNKQPDQEIATHTHGSEAMDSGTMLITSIINHGEADDVMHVAREAGARGGTIINARGTGTEEDVKFFGISLAPEKEMLLIVADKGNANNILEAIQNIPTFSEPGGGIIFTTNVEQFITLGN